MSIELDQGKKENKNEKKLNEYVTTKLNWCR